MIVDLLSVTWVIIFTYCSAVAVSSGNFENDVCCCLKDVNKFLVCHCRNVYCVCVCCCVSVSVCVFLLGDILCYSLCGGLMLLRHKSR